MLAKTPKAHTMTTTIADDASHTPWLRRPGIVALLAAALGSGLGLVASFVLSLETLHLAQHPGGALNCDVNAVLSCSTVARHWSATVFGFPNSFVGMMTMPVMITVVVALLAGARLPRWFVRSAWGGAVLGMIFALWMFYMSFVVIRVLCPWCLTLDVGMLLIFFGMTRYCIEAGVIGGEHTKRFARHGYDVLCGVSVLVLAVALIIVKFGAELL